MNTDTVSLSRELVQFNDAGATSRFGLTALATDMTSERDLYRQLPQENVSIHVARVAFENPTAPENLRKMAPRLTETACLLQPVQLLKAICYSCTAASMVIGDDAVKTSIQASAWAVSQLGGFGDHRPERYVQLFDSALPEHAFGEAA